MAGEERRSRLRPRHPKGRTPRHAGRLVDAKRQHGLLLVQPLARKRSHHRRTQDQGQEGFASHRRPQGCLPAGRRTSLSARIAWEESGPDCRHHRAEARIRRPAGHHDLARSRVEKILGDRLRLLERLFGRGFRTCQWRGFTDLNFQRRGDQLKWLSDIRTALIYQSFDRKRVLSGQCKVKKPCQIS